MAKLRIKQLRSPIGKTPRQRATLRALGLKGIRDEVVQEPSPAVLGMLKKVGHLVEITEEK
jgi:large subunit ribosomal protein L30